MTEFYDPRQDISHNVRVGNCYEDTRTGGSVRLVYCDDEAAILRGEDDNHRLCIRSEFDKYLGAGRYSLVDSCNVTEGNLGEVRRRIDEYRSREGRKSSHIADGLQEAIDILTGAVQSDDTETVQFEDIDNIGETTAQSLHNAGYSTKGDIRSAEDGELLDVYGLGEAGLDNLREAVA